MTLDAAASHSGKVRELYDAGDGPPAHGGLGPGQRLRRHHGRAHRGQGPGAHGHDRSGARRWPTSRRAPSWPPTRRTSRRSCGGLDACRRSGPAGRCSCAGPRCSPSSASSGATSPARPRRSTRRRAPCTARRMPPGLRAGRAGSPSRCSRRRPRPTEGHDLNIDFAAAVDLVGAEAALPARTICLELYAARRGPRRRRRVRLGRHQVRARLRRRRARALRRGRARRTPRACGRPTRWCPGATPPAFDKQPLRDWLAAQPWDRTPPPPALPARGRRGHVGALRRGLRAGHRPLADDWYGAQAP